MVKVHRNIKYEPLVTCQLKESIARASWDISFAVLCNLVTFPSTFLAEAFNSFILSPCPLPKICPSFNQRKHSFYFNFPFPPHSGAFPPPQTVAVACWGPLRPWEHPRALLALAVAYRGLWVPWCSGMAPRFVAGCKYSSAQGRAESGPQPGAGHGSAAKYSSSFVYSRVTQ